MSEWHQPRFSRLRIIVDCPAIITSSMASTGSVLSHAPSSRRNSNHIRRASTNEFDVDIHVAKRSIISNPARPSLNSRSMTSMPPGYVNSRHGKLHRRSGSGSSLLSVTSSLSLATRPDLSKSSATQRIKPYLRKISLYDDDEEQGRIDLSRPSAEHSDGCAYAFGDETTISELDIHEYSAITNQRSVSDVNFIPAVRRSSQHGRATSLSSPLSIHPALLHSKPSFIQAQAMRQTSNSNSHPTSHPTSHPNYHPTSHPYTPPSAFSTTFPHSEDEREESADILYDDLRRSSVERWRSRRTMSTQSMPYASSIHASMRNSDAELSRLANRSQSNLSTRSDRSATSTVDVKAIPSRRNTTKSFDFGTGSSRTSIDRAVSFLSRTSVSEPEDPTARADKIKALRRAFDEKEAAKERKLEKLETKRRDTLEMRRAKRDEKHRWRSDAEPRRRKSTRSMNTPDDTPDMDEKVAGPEYSRHSPVHRLSLPVQGSESGEADIKIHKEVSKTKAAKGVWVRFNAWRKTRMLSCY